LKNTVFWDVALCGFILNNNKKHVLVETVKLTAYILPARRLFTKRTRLCYKTAPVSFTVSFEVLTSYLTYGTKYLESHQSFKAFPPLPVNSVTFTKRIENLQGVLALLWF
jgi:hypothetical protein